MIHVTVEGSLIEERDYATWEGTPTVGQAYYHQSGAYTVDAVIVDTRKGYCEVVVKPESYKILASA